MSTDSFGPIAASIGGGFFVGVLMGYALKKVIKLAAVVVGLFLAALTYLQYQQIANVNWDKLQAISKGAIIAIANATTQLPGIGSDYHNIAVTQIMTNFGIPLTGSMATGFTIGFMKG
jgi:uncharacterized membrane protein (Fun14 family)